MYDNRKRYLIRINTYNIPDVILERARGDLVLLKENAQVKVKLIGILFFIKLFILNEQLF